MKDQEREIRITGDMTGPDIKKIKHDLLVRNGLVRKLPEAKKYYGFDVWDINNAVIVFTDALNIAAGSAGSFQLYELMQAYLYDRAAQDEMNSIVKKILTERPKKY